MTQLTVSKALWWVQDSPSALSWREPLSSEMLQLAEVLTVHNWRVCAAFNHTAWLFGSRLAPNPPCFYLDFLGDLAHVAAFYCWVKGSRWQATRMTFSCLPVGRCGPNYKAELLIPHLYPKDTSVCVSLFRVLYHWQIFLRKVPLNGDCSMHFYGHWDILDIGPLSMKFDWNSCSKAWIWTMIFDSNRGKRPRRGCVRACP